MAEVGQGWCRHRRGASGEQGAYLKVTALQGWLNISVEGKEVQMPKRGASLDSHEE